MSLSEELKAIIAAAQALLPGIVALETPVPPVVIPPVVTPPVVVPPVVTAKGVTLLPAGQSPASPSWGQGMKHVTAAFHPPSGRLFLVGGDYHGAKSTTIESYNQETWSLDLAERMASTDRNAGWRLEYPYDGFAGSVQPLHPDFVGFVWHPSQGVFFMVPGVMVPGAAAPDPRFVAGDVMQFDPVAKRWKALGIGSGPDPAETWMSVYDPVKDVIVRPGFNGGSGGVLNILDCKTLAWRPRLGLGQNALNKDVRINKEYLAADIAGRKVYAVDGVANRVMAFSLDTYKIEDCGVMPGKPIGLENISLLVFNGTALEFLNFNDSTMYTADVAARPLVWKVAATGVTARMGVFDPKNNVSLWAGGVEPVNPNLMIYKHGAAAVVVPPVVPPAPVPVALLWLPPAGEVAAISLNTMAAVNPGAGVWNPNNNQDRVLTSWNSGVFVPDFGPLGALCVCGGGDGDYFGNEVYLFPLADTVTSKGTYKARTWYRINDPSTAMDGTTGAVDPFFNLQWGEHGTDQKPAMPHTYDQLTYLPASAGGGKLGSVILGTKFVAYRTGKYPTAHRCDMDTGVWSRASTGKSALLPSYDAPSWTWFPPTKRLYGFGSNTSPSFTDRFHWLDFSAGAPGIYGSIAAPSHLIPGYVITRYWPSQARIVMYGNTNLTGMQFRVYDPAKPSVGVVPKLTGAALPSSVAAFDFAGDVIYVRSCQAGDTQKLWKVTPNLTGPWNVEMITMKGVTVTGATPNGMWKRFSYAEAAGVFVWVNSVTGAVYAYRP